MRGRSAWSELTTPVVIGHRGGRGSGWPTENTLSAFEKARQEGAHAVELDVRTCASGEVVVFHDAGLERFTAGADHRSIDRVTLAELSTIARPQGHDRIPTLAEVLSWAGSQGMPLNIEIKHDVSNRLHLVRAVGRLLAGARIPLLVSSFDPLVLGLIAIFAAQVPRVLLTDRTQRYARLFHALASPKSGVYGLHVERTQARAPAVAAWKARGLWVGVWTVNDANEAKDLTRVGVDALITDQPGDIVSSL